MHIIITFLYKFIIVFFSSLIRSKVIITTTYPNNIFIITHHSPFLKKTDDILEKLVHINRITKVVKGGRRFGFSALVVVGNQAGKIGIAHAKAKQVPDAIKKANELARRNLVDIPLREGRTIHHDIYGKDGAGKIKLRYAPKGTGIIAGGPVRAVCEVLGIKDLVWKYF